MEKLTREQILDASRVLFSHYGWSNSVDIAMRARIASMRDMALASLERQAGFAEGIEAAAKVCDELRMQFHEWAGDSERGARPSLAEKHDHKSIGAEKCAAAIRALTPGGGNG